ncbi:MAG: DUF2188 domain-containing protein [Candidatus Marinimicrobia bacterium]|jgi:hypothetical protein|nr:DUF2188 domain-containing protein [Candidatus Neomarinimicrobiota bacterium]
MARTIKKTELTKNFRAAALNSKKMVHIVPSNDGWSVKKEGIKRSYAVKETKKEAVKIARNIKSVESIIVHKQDGSVLKIIDMADSKNRKY